MPPKENEDYVPPKDKADVLAEEYENAHHDRSGSDKNAPSHSLKPKSVR
ncbi:hypothetical protein TcYC6_0028760 [Trypanosoma cruzi]|uniref:Uncharacterized protein n=1 Tax=Trypanosoma cruzi (strain CL Brener) TaxID=353153 RepID=Q4CQ04_TRYCC|nr:hypothetical protein, conserved [Trypanosoma cruzi]XP_820298.1 hypothetical protein, conserved [Trypanosoma cruzi]PBJ80074.1 hypothetical protein BCY84_02103 [Trypanosoma cruzi cruzi]EAN82359.1 hypothetical protein, conserved [Trypanosoma cruzi]EAN98447.1 hypothetical protein, conserved [Trypanosoma cruzi]KAF8278225.1 hypothetical protein TcBrA4_0119440 [Trypanosoma cruzi]KAF8280948.1 hypothetical protein TcYC6_0028760 [Trypanosoma cruzi]|eukprot:XP_804210.1 hypothetical protein [Trypanosoma cruzi strain CL Brener]